MQPEGFQYKEIISQALDRLVHQHEGLKNQLEKGEIDYASSEGQRKQREFSRLEHIVSRYSVLQNLKKNILETKELLETEKDRDLRILAQDDLVTLNEEEQALEDELKLELVPEDPNSGRNVILEIRGAAGGEEASIFAADLLRMYTNWIRAQGWKMETINLVESGAKGIKEAIVAVQAKEAYDLLHNETGSHRVQRVPVTESSGRIHTSTAVVIAMAEADDIEVLIEEKDIRVDVFRSSGPGGQSVNTTDSAVRITHLPTGLVVSCQNEKSQHKNRASAMRVLRTRLKKHKQEEVESKRAEERRSKAGSGERSDKIRTYNFPDSRITDHRINYRTNDLQGALDGRIDELLNAIYKAHKAKKLFEVLEQQASKIT